MMLYQCLEQVAHLGTFWSEGQESSSRLLGGRQANVRLLLRIELRDKYKSVFDIVDAKFDSLVVGDRAEMHSHFEDAPMRSINHCPKLIGRDVHERLEGNN